MVKVGDIYQKTGERWFEELGDLVVVVSVNAFEIKYRYICRDTGSHDISGPWTHNSFKKEFTEVKCG
jgi:hypothetical protein